MAEKAGFQSYELFKIAHGELVKEALMKWPKTRQEEWTESIAVGSERFTQKIKESLCLNSKGRTIVKNSNGTCQLREVSPLYKDHFDSEPGEIMDDNSYFWDVTKA